MEESPIIRLPLSRFVVKGDPSNVRLVEHPTALRFPRKKEDLELFVVRAFAEGLKKSEGRDWVDLKPNPSDPPDVLGREGDLEFGIEVGEVKLEARAHDLAQLERFRGRVLQEVRALRPALAGKTLRVLFSDPYALAQVIPRRRKLANLLRTVMNATEALLAGGQANPLADPLTRVEILPHTSVVSPEHPSDPYVQLDADLQATLPSQVREAACKIAKSKLLTDRCLPRSYLLLCSRSDEILAFFDQVQRGVESAIVQQGMDVPSNPCPFDEIELVSFGSYENHRYLTLRRDSD